MDALLIILLVTLGAGLAMPLGAVIAAVENIHSDWLEQEFRHSVLAFGAGALLSAVALVLVPEGIKHQSANSAALWFIAGGFGFMLLDIVLQKANTPASQLAAMLADFIPESIALGATFSANPQMALLLAGIIALQNLPEGFNAYRELRNRLTSGPRLIGSFALMALLGPAAGLAGYLWLHDAVEIVSAIMLFAAGGILYAVFQDMAPNVKLERHWGPPMGTVLGFVLGMVGFMLAH
ncbi:divalent cation transporter [Rheinheimera baltica]|uniref:Divalent cation transporter n=1 Tax=Rheinheimera baltica TaxID=67576 RepID=A0ABT9I1M3_9GAMM|nr:divalent cation transporter [Rheinheimera baltica]MDP5137263.1 divalent cation transporter [Rheinheimera baltica]